MIVKINNSVSENLNEETIDKQISQITFIVNFGVNKGQQYTFQSNLNNIIKFGRKNTQGINIAFADDSTSRLQCTISYDNYNWYIEDSDGVNESSNGTWFLADIETPITNNLNFKAGSIIFQCGIVEGKKF